MGFFFGFEIYPQRRTGLILVLLRSDLPYVGTDRTLRPCNLQPETCTPPPTSLPIPAHRKRILLHDPATIFFATNHRHTLPDYH